MAGQPDPCNLPPVRRLPIVTWLHVYNRSLLPHASKLSRGLSWECARGQLNSRHSSSSWHSVSSGGRGLPGGRPVHAPPEDPAWAPACLAAGLPAAGEGVPAEPERAAASAARPPPTLAAAEAGLWRGVVGRAGGLPFLRRTPASAGSCSFCCCCCCFAAAGCFAGQAGCGRGAGAGLAGLMMSASAGRSPGVRSTRRRLSKASRQAELPWQQWLHWGARPPASGHCGSGSGPQLARPPGHSPMQVPGQPPATTLAFSFDFLLPGTVCTPLPALRGHFTPSLEKKYFGRLDTSVCSHAGRRQGTLCRHVQCPVAINLPKRLPLSWLPRTPAKGEGRRRTATPAS